MNNLESVASAIKRGDIRKIGTFFSFLKTQKKRRTQKHKTHTVWLSGAGISVSAGIPDFRTKGTGLYSRLEKYELPRT
jgi:hypothetical protein